MSLITRGGLELGLRFEQFPAHARALIEERIRALTAEMETGVEAATPYLTGRLRREITARVFTDGADRIAGYVSVLGDAPSEYPKAATLEYGTDRPRRIADHGGVFHRLGRGQKAIESRLTRPVHIAARRYLRDPFEAIKAEAEAQLALALTTAVEPGP